MKRIIYISLAVVLVIALAVSIFLLTNCKKEDATKLSFKSALSYDYLKSIDGKTVTINGYLATSSPADGSFIFLMNMPYQSCPFCVPNTSQLSNTIEVYPKKNQKFSYTNQAVKVTGRLEVAASEDEPFTDKYGYEFSFKIVDAEYTIIKAEDLSADMALWQKVASSGIVDEIYSMYDYVNFTVAWNTYFVNSYTDSSGEHHTGYYLYPSDAKSYIEKDDAQWNYGYKDGYFDSIVKKIEAIDPDAFSDLMELVRRAEALAKRGLDELNAGNYTYEYKYVEKFGTSDYVYTLTNGEELSAAMEAEFLAFSSWLSSWEM